MLRKNDRHFDFGRQQGTEVLPYVPREGLFWLRYEAITDAGLAEEMARLLWVFLDLAPQPGDVDAQVVGLGAVLRPPDREGACDRSAPCQAG